MYAEPTPFAFCPWQKKWVAVCNLIEIRCSALEKTTPNG